MHAADGEREEGYDKCAPLQRAGARQDEEGEARQRNADRQRRGDVAGVPLDPERPLEAGHAGVVHGADHPDANDSAEEAPTAKPPPQATTTPAERRQPRTAQERPTRTASGRALSDR